MYEANLQNDTSASQPQFELVDQLIPLVRKQSDLFRSSKKPEVAGQLANEFEINFERAMNATLESADYARNGNVEASVEMLMKKGRPSGVALADTMNKMTALLNREAEVMYKQAAFSYRTMRACVIAGLRPILAKSVLR